MEAVSSLQESSPSPAPRFVSTRDTVQDLRTEIGAIKARMRTQWETLNEDLQLLEPTARLLVPDDLLDPDIAEADPDEDSDFTPPPPR